MSKIKPIQILLKPLTRLSQWLNDDETPKSNQKELSRKNNSAQKKTDNHGTVSTPENQSTDLEKRETENKVEQPPRQQQGKSLQQQVSHERTGQILAEASNDREPEEKMPDVLLDIPSLKIEEIKLNVDNLDARVALRADLANLVKIDIGVQVGIAKVDLDIKGVDAQAVLKVRLKQVYAILARALDTIDKKPELLQNLLKPVQDTFDSAPENAARNLPNVSGTLEVATNSVAGQGEKSLDSVAAEGAKGVKAQKGELNEAVGKVCKNVDKSIDPHKHISEEERRKMNRIDKK